MTRATRAMSLADFDEAEVAASGKRAALRVVAGMTREKNRPDARDDAVANWRTVVRLAHRCGASPREIAEAAGVSPAAVSKICGAREAVSRR